MTFFIITVEWSLVAFKAVHALFLTKEKKLVHAQTVLPLSIF